MILILRELLDNPYRYKVTYQAYNEDNGSFIYHASFETDEGIPYRVEITDNEMLAGMSKQYAMVLFMIEDDSVPFSQRTGITDTGNAPRIFSTVIEIIKEFARDKMRDWDIDGFSFSAKEPSRRKLYRRLANMLKGEIGLSYVDELSLGDELQILVG